MTIVFLTLFLPFLFVLLMIGLDFANYFGIRDELQRVVDREAHDALVYGKTPTQVEMAIRARMRNVAGVGEIDSVTLESSTGSDTLRVTGNYRGAFSGLAERLYGVPESRVSLMVSSRVRVQPAAALIIVDRSWINAGQACSDDSLQATTTFVDRVVDSWVERAGARVRVGISPGTNEPIDLLTVDESDGVSRCRPRSASSYLDVGAVRGIEGGNPYSATAVAYTAYTLVGSELVAPDVNVRSVVFVLPRPAYDRGYAAELYSLVRDASNYSGQRIDFYAIVVDNDEIFDIRPLMTGLHGGAYREFTASIRDVSEFRLLSALTQTITDRIVLER